MISNNTHLLENLTTVVVVLDAELRVVYLNAAAEELFGLSLRQANAIALANLLPGDNRLLIGLQKVLASGESRIEHEINIYVPGRGEIQVESTITLLPAIDGEAQLLLEMVRGDFQYRVSRDEQLQIQQQVMRGLAHEIKNPLGGLRGAAQLLEKQLDSSDLKEYTQIIIDEADRLQNLMARMLGPHQLAENTHFNIHEVLQRVRQLVEAECDTRLLLISDYDPSVPDLYANFDQVLQILLNIVRNAVQAMNGVGEIILRTRVQRNRAIGQTQHRLVACIEIEDNGPGIPKKLQDTIFYPLVTSRSEGTGLGLYLAQNLAQRNQGAIEYVSQSGQTVFSLFFPLERNRMEQTGGE